MAAARATDMGASEGNGDVAVVEEQVAGVVGQVDQRDRGGSDLRGLVEAKPEVQAAHALGFRCRRCYRNRLKAQPMPKPVAQVPATMHSPRHQGNDTGTDQ